MEIEVLHAARGDKKKSIDTSTEKGRQECAVFLNKLMKSGTAVFIERGKKTYRVKSYDAAKDLLVVNCEVKGQEKEVRTKGRKAKATAVAPVAGGVDLCPECGRQLCGHGRCFDCEGKCPHCDGPSDPYQYQDEWRRDQNEREGY